MSIERFVAIGFGVAFGLIISGIAGAAIAPSATGLSIALVGVIGAIAGGTVGAILSAIAMRD